MAVKYAGKRVSALTPAEVSRAGAVSVFTICTVTGWAMHEDEAKAVIVNDQLCKKLVEDYADVNFKEIEFAFRKFGTRVKDWGKTFNLSLFDEVMAIYLDYRARVSAVEQQIKNQPKELPPTVSPVMTDAEKMEWVEDTKRLHLSGKLPAKLLPAVLYDYLAEKGILVLSVDQKKKLYNAAEMELHDVRKDDRPVLARQMAKKFALSIYFNGKK